MRQDPTTWKFQGKIRSFAEGAGYPESLDTVSIRIRAADGAVVREVYRPFKDSFATRDGRGQGRRRVEVIDVVALPRNGDYQGWWGWLARHPRRGALADVPFGGLRVRMHNIAIGDQTLVQALWTTRPLAMWCFGRSACCRHRPWCRILSETISNPRTPLLGFTHSSPTRLRHIEKEIRDESKDRNTSVRKITQRADRATTQARRRLEEGLTSHNEKMQLIERLDDEAERLNTSIKGTQPNRGGAYATRRDAPGSRRATGGNPES